MTLLKFFSTLLAISLAAPAHAELILSFSSDNGSTFKNDFEIRVGESLNFGIYLQQSEPETVLTSEGLVSWGFDLAQLSQTPGTISEATPNPAFDFANHNVVTSTGFEWEYADSTGLGVAGESVLLGSFRYDATSEGTSVFTLGDRSLGTGPGNASWFTPSFSELDQTIFGANASDEFQFTINAVAVPEPSGLALVAMMGLVALMRRRRETLVDSSIGA